MWNLVPHFILEQYRAGRRAGSFAAVSLHVDISGFTALAGSLMREHTEAAESLSTKLNEVFAPLVEAVYARDGFITTYAGDSFTALFPIEGDTSTRALDTAFAVQQSFGQHGAFQTPFGDFQLQARVGVGAGEVHWGILGTNRRSTYYFRGPALDSCLRADGLAAPGEVVAPAALTESLSSEPIEEGFVRVRQAALPSAVPRPGAPPSLTSDDLAVFLPPAIFELATPAEFRDVVSIFVNFEAPDDSAADYFIRQALELAQDYQGYFRHVDYGDKGPLFVVIFGAPRTFENDPARAADFLLAIRLAAIEAGVRWRAGATFGRAYAGWMGGPHRADYAAVGDSVNRAARLMGAAAWGEAWAVRNVVEKLSARGYQFEYRGHYHFKGVEEPVAVAALRGKGQAMDWMIDVAPLLGREAEIQQLEAFVAPILRGAYAGVAYLYGESGVGKSRLVRELRDRISAQTLTNWFVCSADDVLRASLHPIRHWLRSYFRQSAVNIPGENRIEFDALLNSLIRDLRQCEEPVAQRAESLAAELERGRSFLAGLTGLYWEGSPYEQVDPRLRFENMISAFCTLILAESLRRPVILQVENAQRLDADTKTVLAALARSAAGHPVAVLITSRYQDDGSYAPMSFDSDTPARVIDLTPLSAESTQLLAEHVLGGPLAETAVRVLVDKTEGNPLFVEQLALYLRQRGVLTQQGGEWHAEEKELNDMPSGVSAVLMARLDRLPADIREVVQTAAVLGQEFELRVLTDMLGNDPEVLNKVRQAEAGAIWQASSPTHYVFRHALLRDTAYSMQLRTRLQRLHELAADAIEQLYADDLPAHAADLVYHFGNAGNLEKEGHYARLAGDYAVTHYASNEALKYYNRALELTGSTDPLTRSDKK